MCGAIRLPSWKTPDTQVPPDSLLLCLPVSTSTLLPKIENPASLCQMYERDGGIRHRRALPSVIKSRPILNFHGTAILPPRRCRLKGWDAQLRRHLARGT